MKSQICVQDEGRGQVEHREPQPIGEILAELFAQYQACYPEVRIAVVESPVVAV